MRVNSPADIVREWYDREAAADAKTQASTVNAASTVTTAFYTVPANTRCLLHFVAFTHRYNAAAIGTDITRMQLNLTPFGGAARMMASMKQSGTTLPDQSERGYTIGSLLEPGDVLSFYVDNSASAVQVSPSVWVVLTEFTQF